MIYPRKEIAEARLTRAMQDAARAKADIERRSAADRGNAGAPSATLQRWGPADEAYQDVSIEAMYDAMLLTEFGRQHETKPFSERVHDMAKATGTWEGYTGALDGDAFPVKGWWVARVGAGRMELTFRMRRPDATFVDLYRMRFTKQKGWFYVGAGD